MTEVAMNETERKQLWRKWIDLAQQSDRLTGWEADFLQSISDQLFEHDTLSVRQAEILERIYAEKT